MAYPHGTRSLNCTICESFSQSSSKNSLPNELCRSCSETNYDQIGLLVSRGRTFWPSGLKDHFCISLPESKYTAPSTLATLMIPSPSLFGKMMALARENIPPNLVIGTTVGTILPADEAMDTRNARAEVVVMTKFEACTSAHTTEQYTKLTSTRKIRSA